MTNSCLARLADEQDADEIIRLAALMYTAIGQPPHEQWRAAARAALLERLGSQVVVAVVDHPDRQPGGPRRLAASGAGVLGPRLPGPRFPRATQVGYVQWVATDPDCRRRGYARAVLDALVGWFDAHDVARVELHATAEGEPLYRSLGFDPGPHAHLSRFRS